MRLHSPPLARSWLLAMLAPLALAGQAAPAVYRNYADLDGAMQRLVAANPRLMLSAEVATSAGGKVIHALRLGAGADVATRPAMLVVANAFGPQLIGSEAALKAAEGLALAYGKDSATTRLLDAVTIWFVPRLNPDAAEGAFAAAKWERVGNGPSAASFHDDLADDVVPADLNHDGFITMMRIADPDGDWLADSADPLLMRRADAAKGEHGTYRLMVEGKSSGLGSLWSDSATGGTDVNRNFTHNYAAHGANAGDHSFSSPEAKGLVEFLVAHDMIGTVYVLGPQDNVLTPWRNQPPMGIADARGVRSPEGTSAGGQLNSIMAGDANTFAVVADRIRARTGWTGTGGATGAGDLLSFLYYDFGRWAFGSRVWAVPHDSAGRGATTAEGAAADRAALKWWQSQSASAYVPWTAVTGSGIAGTVEVGGWKPGAMWNPPAGALVDSVVAQQQRAIVAIASVLPRVALHDVKAASIGDGVWRLSADVSNEGAMPTTSAIGARLRNPRGIRVDLDAKGSTLLSGKNVQVLGPIAGGRSIHLEWTIAGARGATINIKAGSPVTGTATSAVTLK